MLRLFVSWFAIAIVLGAILGTVMHRYDVRRTPPRTPAWPWDQEG